MLILRQECVFRVVGPLATSFAHNITIILIHVCVCVCVCRMSCERLVGVSTQDEKYYDDKWRVSENARRSLACFCMRARHTNTHPHRSEQSEWLVC
jgi:hypothetical protein